MRACTVAPLCAAICWATAALAQDTYQPKIQSPIQAPCELHVWPSRGLGAVQNNYNGAGLIGAIVQLRADDEEKVAIKEAHLADIRHQEVAPLSAAVQNSSLTALALAPMLGLTGYKVIVHDEPLESHVIRSLKTRYAASDAQCYADLVVADNAYARDFVNGRSLMTFLRFRTFGTDPAPSRSFGTWVKSGLSSFTMETSTHSEVAMAEVKLAFEHNISNFSQIVAKSH